MADKNLKFDPSTAEEVRFDPATAEMASGSGEIQDPTGYASSPGTHNYLVHWTEEPSGREQDAPVTATTLDDAKEQAQALGLPGKINSVRIAPAGYVSAGNAIREKGLESNLGFSPGASRFFSQVAPYSSAELLELQHAHEPGTLDQLYGLPGALAKGYAQDAPSFLGRSISGIFDPENRAGVTRNDPGLGIAHRVVAAPETGIAPGVSALGKAAAAPFVEMLPELFGNMKNASAAARTIPSLLGGAAEGAQYVGYGALTNDQYGKLNALLDLGIPPVMGSLGGLAGEKLHDAAFNLVKEYYAHKGFKLLPEEVGYILSRMGVTEKGTQKSLARDLETRVNPGISNLETKLGSIGDPKDISASVKAEALEALGNKNALMGGNPEETRALKGALKEFDDWMSTTGEKYKRYISKAGGDPEAGYPADYLNKMAEYFKGKSPELSDAITSYVRKSAANRYGSMMDLSDVMRRTQGAGAADASGYASGMERLAGRLDPRKFSQLVKEKRANDIASKNPIPGPEIEYLHPFKSLHEAKEYPPLSAAAAEASRRISPWLSFGARSLGEQVGGEENTLDKIYGPH